MISLCEASEMVYKAGSMLQCEHHSPVSSSIPTTPVPLFIFAFLPSIRRPQRSLLVIVSSSTCSPSPHPRHRARSLGTSPRCHLRRPRTALIVAIEGEHEIYFHLSMHRTSALARPTLCTFADVHNPPNQLCRSVTRLREASARVTPTSSPRFDTASSLASGWHIGAADSRGELAALSICESDILPSVRSPH